MVSHSLFTNFRVEDGDSGEWLDSVEVDDHSFLTKPSQISDFHFESSSDIFATPKGGCSTLLDMMESEFHHPHNSPTTSKPSVQFSPITQESVVESVSHIPSKLDANHSDHGVTKRKMSRRIVIIPLHKRKELEMVPTQSLKYQKWIQEKRRRQEEAMRAITLQDLRYVHEHCNPGKVDVPLYWNKVAQKYRDKISSPDFKASVSQKNAKIRPSSELSDYDEDDLGTMEDLDCFDVLADPGKIKK